MAATATTLTISVAADVRKAVQGLKDVDGRLAGLGKSVNSGLGPLKGALAADLIAGGFAKIGSAVGEAFSAVQEQQNLGLQTAAVLKSTGNAAGVTAEGVTALADSIEKKSKLDAEAIQGGQNLLLTFTNIKNEAGAGNDIFNQTTQTMADMATAMGQDPKTAAMQLGKALNDPIRGVGALSKVGVTFTAQQKEQIKTMVEAGNTAGAQKVILAELGKEFGGSAAASAQGFSGAMFQLKASLDGVIEGVVARFLPGLTRLANELAARLPGAIDTMSAKASALWADMQPLIGAIETFVGFLKANPEVVKAFAITVGILGGAIAVVTIATAAWNAILALNPIGLVIVAIALLVAAIVYLVKNFDKIKAKAVEVWGKLKSSTDDAWKRFTGAVSAGIDRALSWVRALPGRVGDGLASLGAFMWNAAVAGTNDLIAAVRNGFDVVMGMVWALPGNIGNALGNLGNWLYNSGVDLAQGFINGIGDMVGRAAAKARELASAAGNAIKERLGIRSPSRVTTIMGSQTGQGLINGLVNTARDVATAGRRIATAAVDGLEGGLTVMSGRAEVTLAGAVAGTGTTTYNVTVNAPVGSSPVDIGRELERYLTSYRRGGGRP